MKTSTIVTYFACLSLTAGLSACGGDDDAPADDTSSVGGSGGSSTSDGGSGGTSTTANTSMSSNTSAGGTDPGAGGMAGAGSTPDMNIVEIASGDDRFETLVDALVSAGLDDDLAGEGPFTVFAPTDAAFALLPEGLLASLSADALSEILLYHVVEGAVSSSDVVSLNSATTLEGSDVSIMVTDDTVVLNGLVQVTVTDIEAENGVIHVIDSVLLPGAFPGSLVQAVSAYPRLSTLAGAVSTEVGQALSGDGVTLFAPVNAAFEGISLPEDAAARDDILLYHAVPAEVPSEVAVTLASAQMANGAYLSIKTDDTVRLFDGSKDTNVTYTDIHTANGVIHLIDDVLLPPGTIAEVAEASGLSELLAALGAANVPDTETTFAEAAAGDGPLTVFAPDDAAFMAIPASFGDSLADVLGAHVIPEVVDSRAVVAAIETAAASPATLTGAADNTLSFSLGESGPLIHHMVGITTTDIPARNGLIHLVDSIILPSDVTFPGNLAEAVAAYPNLSSLLEAVESADPGVSDALTGAGPLTLFAPGNAAFSGVDTSTDLTDTLLYHVLPTLADSAFVVENFVPAQETTTAQGSSVTVDGDALTLNASSNIVRVDLLTENGVIHIIDQVLQLPTQ